MTKDIIKNSNIMKYILYALASLVFIALFAPYTTILNDYFGIDSAIFWVFGNGILKDKIPYVELFDNKGPMLFFVWALGIFIGNGTKWGVFILESICLFLDLIAIEKISKMYHLTYMKILIIQGFFLLIFCGTIYEGGLSEEWALPCGLYSLYWAIAYFKQKLKKSEIIYASILGVFLAFVVWMRPNNGALIGAVALCIVIYQIANKKYVELGKSMVGFLFGFLLITVPLVLWHMKYHCLSEMWYSSVTYNFLYASDGFYGKQWKEIVKIISYIGLALLGLLANFIRGYKKAENRKEFVWENVLFGVCTIITGFACSLGYTWQHYFMLYIPCMIVIAIFLIQNLQIKKMICILLVLVLPYSYQIARNAGKCMLFNFAGYYDDVFSEITKIQEIIPEEERDSVWGIGWKTAKYYAANDIVPCYKVFDMPAFFATSEELREDATHMLDENPPLWIFTLSDTEEYIEGLFELLENDYEQKACLENKSDSVIREGQDIRVKLWRHN